MDDRNRERIIKTAGEMFNCRGYRNVTIDDIAGRLGMSKKTIYQYFSRKEDIAEEVMQAFFINIDGRKELLLSSKDDPLTRLKQILTLVKKELSQINPLFLDDVQKYAPDLWDKIEQIREKRIRFMEILVKEGQEAEQIKKIKTELLLLIYLGMIKTIIRPDVLISYGFSMEEAFDAVIDVFLNGISSH
jgi:AcrR family transcriptional regulator